MVGAVVAPVPDLNLLEGRGCMGELLSAPPSQVLAAGVTHV